jgi:hypothetical protein
MISCRLLPDIGLNNILQELNHMSAFQFGKGNGHARLRDSDSRIAAAVFRLAGGDQPSSADTLFI